MWKFIKFERRNKFKELREIFTWNMNASCLSLGSITNYHQHGSLNNKYLFLTVVEAGNSKIKVPAGLVTDRAHFMVGRWPSFLVASHGGEQRADSRSFLFLSRSCSWGLYSHDLIITSKAPSPNTNT